MIVGLAGFLRPGLARDLTQDLDPVWATLFAITEAPRRRPIRWRIWTRFGLPFLPSRKPPADVLAGVDLTQDLDPVWARGLKDPNLLRMSQLSEVNFALATY